MITTTAFAPTKTDLFKVLITRYFKKKWWLFALMIVGGSFSTFVSHRKDPSASIFILVMGIVLPLAICLTFLRYLSSKDNKALYLSRHYSMDFDNINVVLEDGSTSSVKIGNFNKWERIAESYLIYITKSQYYIIPMSSFKSSEDLKWFEVNILGKISMPGFM
jgi:YcxB-like protein